MSHPPRPFWQTAALIAGALLLIGLLVYEVISLSGWRSGPRAPALVDEPVYTNSRAGFRFRVPEDWAMAIRAELPPARLTDERVLVEYKVTGTDKPAALDVTAIDLPPSTSIEVYLAGRTKPEERWQERQMEPITINGVEGVRVTLARRGERDGTTREVVGFRRGERIYLFTGVFATSDRKARDEIRRALESLIWKD
jgi:hypothetical protein